MRIYYAKGLSGRNLALFVTEQSFYDENRRLDRGEGPMYGQVHAALVAAGAKPCADAAYVPDGDTRTGWRTGLDQVIQNLRGAGHMCVENVGLLKKH